MNCFSFFALEAHKAKIDNLNGFITFDSIIEVKKEISTLSKMFQKALSDITQNGYIYTFVALEKAIELLREKRGN